MRKWQITPYLHLLRYNPFSLCTTICMRIICSLPFLYMCAPMAHTMTNQLASFLFLQRPDHLYYINCWMMRKMKTNFCLITLQTNSPSISSYMGLMWWIHFIALQHLHASIPITSHLLVMKSRMRATSAAQGEINCLVRNTYRNICTHGYQHCIDTSQLYTGTYGFHISAFYLCSVLLRFFFSL